MPYKACHASDIIVYEDSPLCLKKSGMYLVTQHYAIRSLACFGQLTIMPEDSPLCLKKSGMYLRAKLRLSAYC